jgi:hypothetical protein
MIHWSGRLLVQSVVPLAFLRDPRTRPELVTRMLRTEAAKDLQAWHGWSLGEVSYKAEVMVPAGVIPKNRPHELEGATVAEGQLDELLGRLDATGHTWVVVATAEVIRHGG